MNEKTPLSLLTKRTLALAAARKITAAAESYARRRGWKVVIAVVDDGGHLIVLSRMDGAQIGSIQVAQAKALTALAFKRPSKAWEDALAGGRHAVLGLPGVTPVEGGLPLVVEGEVVGAIGVSGVTSEQDGLIAQAGAARLAKIT
ncbi:GlcG/HbpS family heme-binding protein [Thiobacter aerophilum]|uniref:Heme-binding protein n=1 Tax=Thiobacter aerophilum TaxID=3121275 RepID=A0ABV0EBU0_9BURK